MNKMKKGNVTILASALVIALVAGCIGAATLAYFSDVETSTGNVFTAGTLNLEVSDDDPLVEAFAVTDTYGGANGEKDWVLKNTGSIAGSLDITFSNLVDLDNGGNEPERLAAGDSGAGSGDLAEVLHLLIYIDVVDDDSYVALDDVLVYNGFASGIVGEQLSDHPMAAGYAKSIRIEWSIDAGVGNEIQSDSAGFDIEFELLQTAD